MLSSYIIIKYLNKGGRMLTILFAVLVMSIVFPSVNRLVNEVKITEPQLQYSCTEKAIFVHRKMNKKENYSIRDSFQISKSDYQNGLPYFYLKTLYGLTGYPDSINALPFSLLDLSKEKNSFRMWAKYKARPKVPLHFLFNSNNHPGRLTIPNDAFRFNNKGIHFLNAETNSVDEKKTYIFMKALLEKGFVFPVKHATSYLAIIKRKEEGFFLVDAKDHLFHLRSYDGKPKVNIVKIPFGTSFKDIKSLNSNSVEKYHLIYTTNKNRLGLLKSPDYEIIELPDLGYVPEEHDFLFIEDIENVNIKLSSKGQVKLIALDKSYEEVDTYTADYDTFEDTFWGRLEHNVLPFTVGLTKYKDGFIMPYSMRFISWTNLLVNLVFVLLFLYNSKKQRFKSMHKTGVSLFLCLTGLYGYIAFFFITTDDV